MIVVVWTCPFCGWTPSPVTSACPRDRVPCGTDNLLAPSVIAQVTSEVKGHLRDHVEEMATTR